MASYNWQLSHPKQPGRTFRAITDSKNQSRDESPCHKGKMVTHHLNCRITTWFLLVAVSVLLAYSLVQNPVTCSGDYTDNSATMDKAYRTLGSRMNST